MKLLISLVLFLFLTTNGTGQNLLNSLYHLIDLEWIGLEQLANADMELNPDTDLTIEEYLTKYNYPLESHNVTTDDGYILTLHRIPHGRNENDSISSNSKPVVLLKHGLFCSAMIYLLIGPEKSLAMLLADAGYDVWLINTRGNRYSMDHLTFNSSYDSSEFWNFSFHEKGYYDLPASIDYIINTTQRDQLTYIGHSQGTTEGLILTSTRPEYNDKLNLMVLLSPIAYVANMTSPPLQLMFKYKEQILEFVNSMNISGFPYSNLIPNLGKIFCNDNSPMQNVCVDFFQLSCGYDFEQFNKSLLTIILANTPSGSSVKELLHYAQEMISGNFCQFDYDEDNEIHYELSTPPIYDISKITVPVAAYYGQNDFMATLPNVEKILEELPNLVVSELLDYELFNHIDFIVAIDVKTLLYDSVIKTIQQYNPV